MVTWPLLTWFWRPDPWHVHVQRSAQQQTLVNARNALDRERKHFTMDSTR
jgi:hypothetical protein